MKVTKDKLNFLSLYSAVAGSSSRNFYNDKLKIEVGNNTSYFSIISDSIILITEVKGEFLKDESFEVMVPIKNIVGLLNSLSDDIMLNINENNISFNSKARYSFEKVDDLTPEKAIDILKSFEGQNSTKDTLFEISKIQPLMKFMGVDGMASIVYDKGHYFSSNSIIMANIPVMSNSNTRLNISNGMCSLLKMLDVEGDTISIQRYENGVYNFQLGETNVFVPETDCEIPDIHGTDKFDFMNHQINVKIDSSELLPVLTRMTHVVTEKDSSSVSFSFKENEILIGTKKYNESVESITAEVDKEIVDTRIVFSLNNFLSCIQTGISFCKNKTIYLGVSKEKDALNIKISIPLDKEESNYLYFFLITNLYSN
jgi:hypothetical protein